MKATFNRVSLVTEIDIPYREPDSGYFLRPSAIDRELSRVLIHEATHYWQQISQFHLLMIAVEDWERLQKFMWSGHAEAAGPLHAQFRKPHSVFGFSAYDLAESTSRYWDITCFGPHDLIEAELARGILNRDAQQLYEVAVASGLFRSADDGFSFVTVDLAMRIVGGSYARPYLYLQQRIGHHAFLLFPLLTHWALQTPAPVTLFAKFADVAARKLGRWQKMWYWFLRLRKGTKVIEGDLEKQQQWLYWQLGPTMYKVAKKAGFPLWSVGQYLPWTPLASHPVYAWAARWQRTLGAAVIRDGYADDLREMVKDPADGELLAADRMLALPGHRVARHWLLEYLAPPVHRFSDDRIWFTSVDSNSDENSEVAHECMAIHTSWERFRTARRGY